MLVILQKDKVRGLRRRVTCAGSFQSVSFHLMQQPKVVSSLLLFMPLHVFYTLHFSINISASGCEETRSVLWRSAHRPTSLHRMKCITRLKRTSLVEVPDIATRLQRTRVVLFAPMTRSQEPPLFGSTRVVRQHPFAVCLGLLKCPEANLVRWRTGQRQLITSHLTFRNARFMSNLGPTSAS